MAEWCAPYNVRVGLSKAAMIQILPVTVGAVPSLAPRELPPRTSFSEKELATSALVQLTPDAFPYPAC